MKSSPKSVGLIRLAAFGLAGAALLLGASAQAAKTAPPATPPAQSALHAAPSAPPATVEVKDDVESAPQTHTPPVTVEVGIMFEKLTKFELGPGTFAADIVLSFTCAAKPCDVQPEALTGKLVGIEKLGEDEHDGKILKVFKARGEFEADVDLSEFPFDKQTLLVPLVDKHSDKYQYHGNVKASGLDPAVKLAGWNVLPKVGVFSMKQEVAPGMVEASTTMGIQIERPRLAAFFKTLAPACFMIFVAAFTLLLRPKSASGRLTAATAGLMSAVMFHAGQTSSLPPLGYMTRMDKFMIATYVVYLVNIFFSVAMVRLEESKKSRFAEGAYLLAAGAVPAIAVIGWVSVFSKVV
jgi:hypothetical protein